jgi:hypothetical protein
MRWPSRFTSRPARVPQVPAVPSGLPGSTGPGRPSTPLELLSDLTSDTGKAVRFVFIVVSVLVVIAACLAGDCFAVMAAARELKGIPVLTTASVGAGSASVLTLVVTFVARWFRKLTGNAGRNGPSTPPSGIGT